MKNMNSTEHEIYSKISAHVRPVGGAISSPAVSASTLRSYLQDVSAWLRTHTWKLGRDRAEVKLDCDKNDYFLYPV